MRYLCARIVTDFQYLIKYSDKMKASLILPVYNSEKYIEECLDSVETQTFKDFELIIINDNSQDNTTEILKKRGHKFYSNDENLGFCKTINKGIKLAKGEYVVFLDHDMVYEPDYLKKSFVEDADLIGARSYYYKDKNQIRSFNIKINPITGRTSVVGRDEVDKGQYDSLKEIEAIGAGSLIVKKSVFENVGLFNEKLIMYFVDLDFCLRARKKGYKIVLSKAKCFHKKQEVGLMTKDQKKRYFHDKEIFMRNYPLPYLITKFQIILNKIFK